jgi:PTS system nitrogen regulatory IIA component
MVTNPEIMTIEEVSEYLRVSERTAYDWAQKGEIPGGKIGTVWRFKRDEIERWVNQRLGVDPRKKPTQEADIASALTAERILLKEFASKRQVLDALISVLATTSQVHNRDELTTEIYRREKLMSTGIGAGIGVPHVRLVSVDSPVMGLAVSSVGITDYESLDGEPVRIICMIAAGRDQHVQHIQLLAAISRRLKDAKVRRSVLESTDPWFVLGCLTRLGD